MSNVAHGNLDKIVTKAAAERYNYGDGRSSSCGPTALFASLDLRYAPIVDPASLVSTVADLDDTEFEALVQAGVHAGYFVREGKGVIVTVAGHRRARIVSFQSGRESRLYFEDLTAGTVSLEDAVLLHVSDGNPRNYPVWFGELEVTFPNAGRPALEAAIRNLRAGGLLEDEAAAKKMSKLPFHIDDVNLTPLLTIAGIRAAARLRSRDDVLELLKPLGRNIGPAPFRASSVPHRVFIGHGRAPDWRELRDFIDKRLGLEVVEFNATPTAGVATKERLEEMLNTSAFAFIVATAEDLASDGSVHARENVIHEIGLFQGRLGFLHAIVVLEEGCAEFSNITGVGQLRFTPRGIASTFEDVRRLLDERFPVAQERWRNTGRHP